MKKYFSPAIFLLLLASCSNNNSYEINGSITGNGLDGQYVYLYEYKQTDAGLLDSALIENNKFKLTGKQTEPVLRILTTTKSNNPAVKLSALDNRPFSVGFVLENGKINVNLNDHFSEASGTAENNALKQAENSIREQNKELRDIIEQLGKVEEGPERDALYEKGMGISTDLREAIKDYVISNSDKVSGAKLLADFNSMFSDDERVELIERADATFLAEPVLQPTIQYIEEIKPIARGAKFTDFEMNDIEGNPRKLSDYVGNGKIVIADFWASWCGPCRAAMPDLIKLYEEYKDQGVEVIGISLDNSQEAWEKGVQDLNIPWTQLSDLQGWKNEAAQIYRVRSIPNLMVFDKDGTILARNLHGEALEKKIKENL